MSHQLDEPTEGSMSNMFKVDVVAEFTTNDDEYPETFRLVGSAYGLRQFCNWLDDQLNDEAAVIENTSPSEEPAPAPEPAP
jgi:hypothetical protein